MRFADTYLDAAREHGEASEPEHEIGDLQQLFGAAFGLLTPDQREAFHHHADVQAVLECGAVDVSKAERSAYGRYEGEVDHDWTEDQIAVWGDHDGPGI